MSSLPLILAGLALLAGTFLLDALVRPRRVDGLRPWRSGRGSALLLLMSLMVCGLFLALCGNVLVSAVLALALQALLALASNAKRAMLGEPLLFSDHALIGAIFRHPQFYLSALRGWQKLAIALVAGALVVALAWLFVPDPAAHVWGAGLALASWAALVMALRSAPYRALAQEPDAAADVACHGLVPTLLLHWLRWRASADPVPCPAPARLPAHADPDHPAPDLAAPELIVAVQCESFADPAELFGDPAMSLPGLAAARAQAWQWGDLQVSGFGAYTMRTEYAVLFGREEAALGFRRFDPFLTALRETSYALPHRLGTHSWRSLFVHPHDMRFYGRDRILPAGGFAELVGEERFAPPGPGEGRYVHDAAITRELLEQARRADGPTLLYAVTIENHGPWSSAKGNRAEHLVEGYRELVGKGDAMLSELTAGLAALERPAMLVFFGDHRPSIPGASAPGGPRHTPYVVLRFDAAGQVVPGANRRRDLTPAALHHAILEGALGRERDGART